MPAVDDPQTDREALFEIRCCTRAGCGLRFSALLGDVRALRCPTCRALTEPCTQPYGRLEVSQSEQSVTGVVLDVLLDNIRSAWNVGSMLRAADGAGVRRVHLCGVSAEPNHPKVVKTSLGAERSLAWQVHKDGYQAARALKEQGLHLWALEGGPRAENMFSIADLHPPEPLVLVVGNELTGVDPEILSLCERVVSLPMLGVKGSLNVAVAFGIAVYTLRFGMAVQK